MKAQLFLFRAILAGSTAVIGCSTDPAFDVVERDPNDPAYQQANIPKPVPGNQIDPRSPSEVGGEKEVSLEITPTKELPSEPPVGEPEEPSSPHEPETTPSPLPNRNYFSQKFVQSDRRKLDILWVIDSSGSMSEIQSQIRQNFREFAEYMQTADIDFQMAVTTTDVCTGRKMPLLEETCPKYQGSAGMQGRLIERNGISITGSESSELLSEFAALSNVGVSGSSFEHGLTAAKLAISREVTTPTLMREGAFLAVMIVSDEEDDGVGLARDDEQGLNYWRDGLTRYSYDAKAFVSDLKSLLPDGRYSVNSIVGTRTSNGNLCTYRSGSKELAAVEEGTEYRTASLLTGGLSESICDQSWSSKFSRIAEKIDNQLRSFKLDYMPDENSLVVKIDGQSTYSWGYDPSQNAITFSEQGLPPPGSSIEVSYVLKN